MEIEIKSNDWHYVVEVIITDYPILTNHYLTEAQIAQIIKEKCQEQK